MFERVVVVDWSAAATPRTGADSIWIAAHHVGTRRVQLANLPTRAAAYERLLALACGDGPTLLGVDFPLGYPAGFASAAGLVATPTDAWESVWRHLAASITDDHRNRNNRWAVATDLNRRLGTPHFWGAPPSAASGELPARKPRGDGRLPELRACERELRATGLRPFSVWQLLGAGSVGSQSLTGIPVLERLRRGAGDRVRVWPFETGLRPAAGAAMVIAEVWPSAIPFDHVDHPVKDARQVTALAARLAELDRAGELAALFCPRIEERVATEEGWVLGLP